MKLVLMFWRLSRAFVRLRSGFGQFRHERNLDGKTIVFNTVRSLPIPMLYELFLARMLAALGARCYVLLDDGVMEHWDTVQLHQRPTPLNPLRGGLASKLKCLLFRKSYCLLFKHRNVRYLKYSDLSSGSDLPLDEADRADAISSVRRYFESGIVDLEDSEQKQYMALSLKNCQVSKTVASHVIERLKPHLVLTSHGIYSAWGCAYRQFAQAGVPTLVFGIHSYARQHVFITDTIVQLLEFDSDWTGRHSRRPLDEAELERTRAFLDARIQHKALDTKIYYGGEGRFNEVDLPRDEGQVNFCMFPNIVWDGDVANRDLYFDGIVDWMVRTIRMFEGSRHRLILRFHPAEATLWTDSIGAEECILRQIPDLYERPNIHIIKSSHKINTYDFVSKNVDIALVYDGILALEIPYLGVPVVSPSKGRFPGGSFIIKPPTLEGYEEILRNPERIIADWKVASEFNRMELMKYANWFFFTAAFYLPIFDANALDECRLHDLRPEEMDLEHNVPLRRTVDRLLAYL